MSNNSKINVVFYEDHKASQFYPISLTRPVHYLVCGCMSIKDRIIKSLGIDVSYVYHVIRPELHATFKEREENNHLCLPKGDTLFIDARLLYWKELDSISFSEEKVYKINEETAAFFIKGDTLLKEKNNEFRHFHEDIANVKVEKIDGRLINYLWDLVDEMPNLVDFDFKSFYKTQLKNGLDNSVKIYGDDKLVYIDEKADIHPHVVIDTRNGAVVIEQGAEVQPFSRIEGPSYIGRNAIVLGAKVRSGSYIGENCRVGGEVENSILHANSNKYHEGFLGHSYIGEWINLGALTTNSDLKNNYSEVEVYVDGKRTNTNSKKVGCFIGDHSKTSIGTLINTGTYIGVMCNILASGVLIPKYIPSFSNYSKGKFLRPFPLKNIFNTAEVVKSRRDEKFTENEKNMLINIFEDTKEKRNKLKGKS